MRILLAAPTFGVYGGIEVFVMTLADWLCRNTRHDVRVCFKVVAGHDVDAALASRCAALGLPCSFVRRGSSALLRNIRWAELVHGNTCSPDIALLSKLTGRPLLLTIHNWCRGRRGLRHRLWLTCNHLADWRTYNSRFVLETWEPGGPRANSDLMPTVSWLPQQETPPEQRRGFFFIARLIENKGVDILIKAYERARLDKSRWPLTIAGDGPLGAWARSYIAEHALPNVELVGFLSEEEKARRIASAMWLVAPANTREDMGLTPIEARNVGVPAIVTRDGGLPESGGPAALLCAPGSVEDLAAQLERAATLSPADYRARATLARESLRTYLRPLSDYVAIYERLTAPARSYSTA
ncbi:MAG TPA: glycosyltransferase family 4 protein [Steroidobacteraceae bacterium]|nr:glycosyltransferase family 4 protein [Steroidobacteraceae bacterium]